MKNSKPAIWKKTMVILASLAVLSIIPSSFADDLIQTLTGGSTDSAPVEQVSAEEAPVGEQLTPSPSPSPSDTSTAQPSPSPSDTSTAKPSPTPSPSPTPPHALANQSMRIIAPSEVNVDPRARSVFLPDIYVSNTGNLLICASSNLGSFDANVSNLSNLPTLDGKSSLEISGANSPYLRISSLGSQAVSIINSGNGLRVFSPSRALAGSNIQLSFIALSEVSTNPKLCGDGSASNTRTISLRGLGIDLNITKSGITLK
jgi:hypothetical protein